MPRKNVCYLTALLSLAISIMGLSLVGDKCCARSRADEIGQPDDRDKTGPKF